MAIRNHSLCDLFFCLLLVGGGTGSTVALAAMDSDLVVRGISTTTTSVTERDSITVDYSVMNQGSAAAGSSNIRFYMSMDTSITTTDIDFGFNVNVPQITAGGRVSNTVTLQIPDVGLAPGNYYIGAIIDADNYITESNEDNNSLAGLSITLVSTGTDLVVKSISTETTTVTEGDSITLDYRVKNKGSAASGYTYMQFYLSTDATITKADITLGSAFIDIPSILGGGIVNNRVIFTIPHAGLAAGRYYIGAIVDQYDNVFESNDINENNNALTGPSIMMISTGTDLVVGGISTTTTSVMEGNSIKVDYSVTNQGSAASDPTYMQFYLSTDATITRADIILGSPYIKVPGILGGGTVNNSVTFTIPYARLATGSYYIGAIVDQYDSVQERNEGNNALTGPSLTILSSGTGQK